MALTFVISFPIAAILDKALGHDGGNFLSKNKMKRMFEMYEKEKLLTPSERKIMSTALEMQENAASLVMTDLDKAFMLEIDSLIDQTLMR